MGRLPSEPPTGFRILPKPVDEERGGPRVNAWIELPGPSSVRRAVTALAAVAGLVAGENARAYRPEVRMDAVVVQKMAHGDVDLMLGLKHDPAFGPVIMAGLGECCWRCSKTWRSAAAR